MTTDEVVLPVPENRLVFDRKELIGAWVAVQTGQDTTWGDFYAMGIMKGSTVISGVVFNNMNESNCTAHIAVEKPTKLLLDLIAAACYYVFNQCRLKRMTGMVPTSDLDVIAFDKHIGFEEEFIMKDAAADGDMQVLVLTPVTASRWLERAHG